MQRRKTTRRVGEVIGVIEPETVYDTEAVMEHAGIGYEKLKDERDAGRIRPQKYNGRHWYRGRDLIALIFGEAEGS